MTVKELKDKLNEFPDDLKVVRSEGLGYEDIYLVKEETVINNFIKKDKEKVIVIA